MRRGARRHDQERKARFADGTAHAARASGPRRLSSYRQRSDPLGCSNSFCPVRSAAQFRRYGLRASISKSLTSTSAIRQRTSFRPRFGSSSISASTTHGRPCPCPTGRAARRGVSGRRALHADFRSDQCGRVSDQARPFTDLVAGAVKDVTGHRPHLSTGGGTSDARFIKTVCPVVELGLVNATIHAVDERVRSRISRD